MGKYVMTDFGDFLRSQRKGSNPDLIAEERKAQWIESVVSVYQKIELWLTQYKKDKLIHTHYHKINIYEGLIGDYETQKLDLIIGSKVMSLVPVGTYILGSYGRIDIKGNKGTYLLVQREIGQWVLIKNRTLREDLPFTKENLFKVIEEIL